MDELLQDVCFINLYDRNHNIIVSDALEDEFFKRSNALKGRNPDALPELEKAAEDVAHFLGGNPPGDDKRCSDKLYAALKKFKGES